MKALQVLILFILALSGNVFALVNGKAVAVDDWRSVVLLQLINPDNFQHTSCTGVILSESYAITSASCVLNKETGKLVPRVKVCIGQKKPFISSIDGCYESAEIYSHHGYINATEKSAAYNLAYIKFNRPLNLSKLKVNPAIPLSPNEFTSLINEMTFPDITWVGFDANGIQKSISGRKQQALVKGAEYHYQSRSMQVTTADPRPGKHYQGMASFIQSKTGEWKLIGLVNQSTPDNIVIYYPELNPCDEDPIIVRYPRPIMQVTTVMSVYPVAACGMVGFLPAEGFDELSCKRLLLKKLNWSDAIANESPVALRQRALFLYNNKKSTDDAGEIYKLLSIAYAGGDQKAGIKLAKFLLEGRVFVKDVETARQLIDQLLEQNAPSANLMLAKLMLFPTENEIIESSSIERDKSILSLLEVAANSGLAEAQYLLGRLHQLGVGTKKNHKKAYNWYALAAMQGLAKAQFQLGMQWKDGRGVRPYLEVAEFWIQQAATQGHLQAQNRLGLLKPVAKQ